MSKKLAADKTNGILFRASECGNFIRTGRARHWSGISATGYRKLAAAWLYATHGIRRQIVSKELRKGILCEDTAIDILSRLDGKMYVKNQRRINDVDKHLSGECDIYESADGGRITDVKCPWDAETFMMADLDTIYEWQLRAYMLLYDAQSARLAYVLCDIPDDSELYADELRKFMWNAGIIDDASEAATEAIEGWRRTVNYSENPTIALEDRVKIFEIERDADKEKLLIDSLSHCAELWKQLSLNK